MNIIMVIIFLCALFLVNDAIMCYCSDRKDQH